MQPSARHDPATGERVYRNTCSLCHRLGLKGAPRLGDTEDWGQRLAQGSEVLYDRAIKGYRGKKGSMPSRGSNAKLSGDEVRAAVDYMVWYSVPKSRGTFGSHVFSATAKQFTIR
jgi:cytochrome c5